MPVYNSGEYLSETIDSVLQQSFSDFELIIVNDGSTDNSAVILNGYAEKDDRIRIIDQGNAGPSHARNIGIEASQGKMIFFMDSDDVIDRNMLKECMENAQGFDMVICGVVKHYIGSDKADRHFCIPEQEIVTRDGLTEYLKHIIKNNDRGAFFNFIWNKIFSADVIKNNNIRFDESISLGEDFIFISDFLKLSYKIKVVDGSYYQYNVRGRSSLVGRFVTNELDRRKRIYSSMKSLYEHYSIYEECQDALEFNEGSYSWLVVRKINYPTCKLNRREKIQYIDGFLKDIRKDYMLKYLSTKKGSKSMMKRALIRMQNPTLLFFFISSFGRKD